MMNYLSALFYVSFPLLCMEPEAKKIQVSTSDGAQDQSNEILEKYLVDSRVIAKIKKDLPKSTDPIPLPNIPTSMGPALKNVLRYYYILRNEKSKIKLEAARRDLEQSLDTQLKLYTLLSAANYLDLPDLLMLCIEIWARENYAPSATYPIAEHLDTAIAARMDRTKKLLDDVGGWVAQDLHDEGCTFSEITLFPDHRSVWSNALSPNGKLLASGYSEGSVSIHKVETAECLFIETGHRGVSSLQFDADGSRIWSSGPRGEIKAWDVATGGLIATFSDPACFGFVFRYLPKCKVIVTDTRDDKLLFFDFDGQKKSETRDAHTRDLIALEAAHNGTLFASAGDDGTARLWNAESKAQTACFNYDAGIKSVCFNSQDTLLACGDGNGFVTIKDIETSSTLLNKKEHESFIWSVLFAGNQDSLLCSGGVDNNVHFWDLHTGRVVITLATHRDDVQSLVLNRIDNLLYSASHDKTIKIWDMRKLTEPIYDLRKEFFQRSTINQILMLKDADKSEIPLNISNPSSKKHFDRFSPEAQRLMLKHLNLKKGDE